MRQNFNFRPQRLAASRSDFLSADALPFSSDGPVVMAENRKPFAERNDHELSFLH